MNWIKINYNHQQTEEHFNFLIGLEKQGYFIRNWNNIFWLLLATIILIVLLIFTAPDNFIVLKVISIPFAAICWLFALIKIVIYAMKIYKRKRWKTKHIALIENTNALYDSFGFDDQSLYSSNSVLCTKTDWDFYTYYCFYKNTIFLIPKTNIYESTSVFPNEIDEDSFEKFKAMATSKLIHWKIKIKYPFSNVTHRLKQLLNKSN